MPEQLVPDPEKAARQLKLLWIPCGDKDGLIYIQTTQARVPEREERAAHLAPRFGGHELAVWRNALYLFAQRTFR